MEGRQEGRVEAHLSRQLCEIIASCSNRLCANKHGHITHVNLGLALKSQDVRQEKKGKKGKEKK